MPACTVCNWAPHDVSIHGELCKSGRHPISVVGRTSGGRCRACHAERAKRYADADREKERERCRRYHWANRDTIIERKRSKRSGRAVIGQRRGHRGDEGAPPPPDHPWRK